MSIVAGPHVEVPSVLVFDVNETLIDIEFLNPIFERIFGDSKVMREWFANLVNYSMAATLANQYVDFFSLAQGVLEMVASIHGRNLDRHDGRQLLDGMLTMPPHADVDDALKTLRDNGYRLATLTNSPPNAHGPTPLEKSGLTKYFDHQFSVHTFRVYKPATELYRRVAAELNVAPTKCMMVAAHPWDNIGAQSAGFSAALITRSGNADLRVAGLPQPSVVARDLTELANILAANTSDC